MKQCETESDASLLTIKGDANMYWLQPRSDWHEAKVTGRASKDEEITVVGLMLNEQLMTDRVALIWGKSKWKEM